MPSVLPGISSLSSDSDSDSKVTKDGRIIHRRRYQSVIHASKGWSSRYYPCTLQMRGWCFRSQCFADNDCLTAMPLPLTAGFASRKQKLSSHVYYDDQLDEISSTDHKKDMYSTTDSMPDSTTGNDFWNDFWPALNGQLITSQEGSGSRVVSSKGGAESLARKGGAEIWNPGAQFSAGSWTEMGYPRGLGSSQSQSYGGFWSDRSASVEQQQDGTTQPKQVHYAHSPGSFLFEFFKPALSDGATPYPMLAHLQQEAIRQSEQFSALQQHVLLCHQQSTAQHHQQPGDWSTQRHESAQQQQQQLSTSSNNPVSSQNLDVNDNQLQQLHQLHQLHHLQQLRGLTEPWTLETNPKQPIQPLVSISQTKSVSICEKS
jgi:hypothetical protein